MPEMSEETEGERVAISARGSLLQVLREDGTLDPDKNPDIEDLDLLRAFRQMVETRFLDERLTRLQRQGRIGFHVGCLGEEAAIIGSALALQTEDWIFPCYREFGAALLRGMPYQSFIDNLYGNANDTAKGRQMPDHYTCRDAHWVSISSPVGTQINQATGFAWASKLKGETAVTLVYFGDGATSSNDFHSGLNFAGVFKAPVVFLCRNNGWAISVPYESQTASPTIAHKGQAYGVHAVRVDGNDLFAVYRAVRDAADRARAGHGPTLVEALTYRMGGHSTSDDPGAYRDAHELEPWQQRDPVERVRHYLMDHDMWTAADDAALDAELEKRFLAAVEAAENTPQPEVDTMFDDVYEKLPWHLREQREQVRRGRRPFKGGG